MDISGKGSDTIGRSPYGERGLKFDAAEVMDDRNASLSLRRAWIEIQFGNGSWIDAWGRSPYGERGLKYDGEQWQRSRTRSLSLRRAWIEISR